MDWIKELIELDKEIDSLKRRLVETDDSEEELHIILELEGRMTQLNAIRENNKIR